MVGQTPTDAPFGLQPNVAAGLAYLFAIVGGIVMLVGGGSNKFVKWAACQSIVLFIVYFVVAIVGTVLMNMVHIYFLMNIIYLLYLVATLYAAVNAFQNKEVRLPMIADWTQQFFGSQLG